ncbi:hypothetical protein CAUPRSCDRAFT_12389 [Caulochytrium protostelioides]|uniref:Phosphoglycerate mutase-like protein n=1 Tax=Caulochytrium protostelioides TaxID=1555241 RepID=A0A4P9WTB2_9FUNG|nr:hypothetical protein CAUPRSCDRAFT_12389 [Caulochytrium protostelioides]
MPAMERVIRSAVLAAQTSTADLDPADADAHADTNTNTVSDSDSDKTVHVAVVAHGRLLRILLSSLVCADLRLMEQFQHHNTCVNVVDVIYTPDAAAATDATSAAAPGLPPPWLGPPLPDPSQAGIPTAFPQRDSRYQLHLVLQDYTDHLPADAYRA